MTDRGILFVCLWMLMVVSHPYRASAAETSFPTVILGIAFDEKGSIVASDPQIEYALAEMQKRLNPEDIPQWVRYLPPLSVNYEDLVTHKAPETKTEFLGEKSIKDLFAAAFDKYSQKRSGSLEDYVLLVARRVTPESRPLISVWWFTYIQKDKLKPPK
jgi:hypothetical protein